MKLMVRVVLLIVLSCPITSVSWAKKDVKNSRDEILFPNKYVKIDPEVANYAYGTPEYYAIDA